MFAAVTSLARHFAGEICPRYPSKYAFAGQKTVTLAVRNMYCAACPAIVKSSLTAVPGVTSVAVSYGRKTAVVTFDDAKTNVSALVTATTNAGYPSAPAN
jgi:mercuric ion binding protein